jgi:hypothetical protein
MAWDDEAWAEYEAQLRTQAPCYSWPRTGPAGLHLPRKEVQPVLRYLSRRRLFSQEQAVQPWDQLPKRWPDFAACTYIASQGKFMPFVPWDYQLDLVRTIRAGAGMETRNLRTIRPDGTENLDFYAEWAAPPAEAAPDATIVARQAPAALRSLRSSARSSRRSARSSRSSLRSSARSARSS